MKFLIVSFLCFLGISHVLSLTCEIEHESFGYSCLVANQEAESGEIAFLMKGSNAGVSNNDIKQVEIKNTPITKIPASIFTTFPNIEFLLLDNTRISNWNQETLKVQGISKLLGLFVDNNPINHLKADTFKEVPNLYLLRLFNCSITEVNVEAFKGLTELTLLRMHQNKITTTQNGVFASLKKLEELDLARNQITELPTGIFSELKELKELDLVSNRLTEIPKDIFKQNTKLNKLKLTEMALKPIDASKLPTSLTRLFVGKYLKILS
ncbi:unnamed protein product [Diamesa serratosioi]